MDERVLIGDLAELERAGSLVVCHRGREILVVRSDGELFAVDNECPHMGSQLQRGEVRDGKIVCPWHGATFELRTGTSESLFADNLAAYTVLAEGNRLYLVFDSDGVTDDTGGTDDDGPC